MSDTPEQRPGRPSRTGQAPATAPSGTAGEEAGKPARGARSKAAAASTPSAPSAPSRSSSSGPAGSAGPSVPEPPASANPGTPANPEASQEPSLDEQIAAYQREFRDLDPQVEQVVSALGRLNRRMNVAYGRQVAALGISNAEWEVLKTLVLSGAPYRLGPGDLAKRLGLTPAAMTHRIDRMATEGLVTRDRDESNRVRVIVELTDEGRAKWLEAMRMATDFEEELLQDLSGEERGVLGEMLIRLLRRVEQAQPDAGGRLTDLDQGPGRAGIENVNSEG
ncbi:MarR family transcriptional regulator [Streptomyces tirandamycinicus]|uniref:MarR family transcriptional regulator n=1 Tax=Streptomyces tirandamycinicus TaxID=2174846 RepID=A0A2S1SQ45_9ACTN|nr:MarR family transcriptional regulator [Streptomyces tirandamycinicus]